MWLIKWTEAWDVYDNVPKALCSVPNLHFLSMGYLETENDKTDPAGMADPHHFNADPHPAFQFNSDPDPPFHFPDQASLQCGTCSSSECWESSFPSLQTLQSSVLSLQASIFIHVQWFIHG
jgi:hypothetical protein